MDDNVTDEDLMRVWDDESGTPPPMTAAEMDRRLETSTERIRRGNDLLEARNRVLEDLLGRYSAVLERLEADRGENGELTRPELRRLLTDLAEHTAALATAL